MQGLDNRPQIIEGLKGVYFATSEASFIDGEIGKLLYRGYNIHDVAESTTFEETAYLLLKGQLPNRSQLAAFDAELKANRELPPEIIEVIRQVQKAHPMDVLRTAMSEAAAVEVPEPSPLFWQHLSRRVHEAVTAEGIPRSRFLAWGWARRLPSWRGWAVAGVAAAVMISIYLTTPRQSNPSAGMQDTAVVLSDVEAMALPFVDAADDPWLALVADLTSSMDGVAFDEVGWTSHAGAVDEAVVNLTDDERLELQRLLNEELAKS